MLKRSTIQLLRFHFSFFLMPVFLFAISQLEKPDWNITILIFVILHFLVYPSSNGYNSYMDRDEGSIGGIKNPLPPTRELFYISVFLDVLAIILSLFVSPLFAAGILLYILASRAYSYRGIRLKKYAFAGYLTVVIFQGAVTFYIVYHGAHQLQSTDVPIIAAIASSLLIGGFYPLTQIYQHEADRKDGVNTLSATLGYKGTFVFTGVVYLLAFIALFIYFFSSGRSTDFFLLNIFMSPIIVYFFMWAKRVWQNNMFADYRHTMKMNILACTCTNLAFITLIIRRLFE